MLYIERKLKTEREKNWHEKITVNNYSLSVLSSVFLLCIY